MSIQGEIEFRISKQHRGMIITTLLLMVSGIVFMWHLSSYDLLFDRFFVVILGLLTVVALAMVYFLLTRPFLSVSEEGISFNPASMMKFLPWDAISSVAYEKTPAPLRSSGKQLVIHRSDRAFLTSFVRLDSGMIDGFEDLLLIICEKLPHLCDGLCPDSSNYKMIASVLDGSVPNGPINYKGLSFTSDGIVKGDRFYLWADASEIQYPPVISGYGSTTVAFGDADKPDGHEYIVIPARMSQEYRDAVLFTVHHARNASINEGILGVLKNSISQARQGNFAVMSVLLSIILLLLGLMLGGRLTLDEADYTISAALAILGGCSCIISPILMFMMKDNRTPAFVLGIIAILASAGTSIAIFSTTPASVALAKGWYYEMFDDNEKAKIQYGIAVELSDSIDALHDLARVERKAGLYGQSFEHMSRAYEKKPLYWGPGELKIITSSLERLGRFEEFEKWCDRLIIEQAEEKWVLEGVKKNCGRD